MKHWLRTLSVLSLSACTVPLGDSFSDPMSRSFGGPEEFWPLELDEEACQELADIRTDPGDLPRLSTLVKGEKKELPLKHTDVQAFLEGYVAEVVVTQTYENPFTDPIEALYTFPLPENSAVFDMRIEIGERVIQSVVKKREEARKIYEEAKREGYTAALLEQQRPNVFTQSVANMEPQKPIKIVIRYVQDLSYDGGWYEFVFPMVVGPRFFPPPSGEGEFVRAKDDAAYVNPPVLGAGERSGHDISLSVFLKSSLPIQQYRAPTHRMIAKSPGEESLHLALSPSDSIPNRDFILRYQVGTKDPVTALSAEPLPGGGGYLSLVVQPPMSDLKKLVGDREIVFVVDVSGSMTGVPLEMCKDAMRSALSLLRPSDTFTIITFAGATEQLFPKPRPANRSSIEEAMQFVDKMMAGGGTYMANAVDKALSTEVEAGRNRYVFFLTDGYVGNETEILASTERFVETLKKKGQKAKVFGFGVGSSPNRLLLDGISKAGEGTTVYSSTREDPVEAVNTFYRYIDHSILEDVSIDWGGLSIEDVYPQKIPDLFASRPLILHARYTKAGEGTITITGKANGKKVALTIAALLPSSTKEEKERAPLQGILWARSKVEDLSRDLWGWHYGAPPKAVEEITDLGIDFHLVTRFTSLVAVDRTKKVSDGAPKTVVQPVEVPEGMDPDQARAAAGEKVVITKSQITIKDSSASGNESTIGGLYGDKISESEGGYGLGLKGSGVGGGGVAAGTIGIGNAGAVGRGAGYGRSADYGSGVGTIGGKSTSAPKVSPGKSSVSGSLDKNIIQRVIRRGLTGIKYCYEKELQKKPKLSGRLVIKFVIGPDGKVTSAEVKTGFDAAVDKCVAKKIKNLSFPAPKGGGVVTVSYPFTFQPAEAKKE